MYTLGVAGGFGHDGSVCLLHDGELIAFAEEERLIRSKLAYRTAPVRAALHCVKSAGISLQDVDAVAFGWDPALDRSLPVLREMVNAFLQAPTLRALRPREIVFLPHHECHAAMALLGSNYAADAVLVMDGRGEAGSTTVYRAAGLDLGPVLEIDAIDSLGSFYSAATRFAGFGRGGEGKLMGLAAYGDPAKVRPMGAFLKHADGVLARLRADRSGGQTDQHRQARPGWFEFFTGIVGGSRQAPIPDLDQFDLLTSEEHLPPPPWPSFALAVQQELEAAVEHMAQLAITLTGATHLALSGGVALNCSANGRLRRRWGSRISLHALVGDAGTSIGAAALQQHRHGIAVGAVQHAYLGPGWTDEQVRSCLVRLGCSWRESADLPRAVAGRLADGHMVGWFQGPAEAGPRALGHRSIIAAPAAAPGMARRLNEIKRREAWRPFAPSIRQPEASVLFGAVRAPFMLEAVEASPAAIQKLPRVVHHDGTSRLHVPQQEASPRFHRLLEEVASHTGYGVVLNTSFNIGPEPIVCTPVDAVRSFFGSPLDVLAIGPFLVDKRR